MMRSKHKFSLGHEKKIILVSLAYFLTRFGHLSRELVSEEGFFLFPGRNFFERGAFSGYWGHMPQWWPDQMPVNYFHKPPLTSLLVGLFSFMGHDPVAGAILVPFLVGFAICLLPLVITRSIIPSLLILASPFFFAAASHIQTDPTVGLLGYGFVSVFIYKWFESEGKSGYLALAFGLTVLWCGKIEIAVISTVALCLIGILLQVPLRTLYFKNLISTSLLAFSCFILLTWLLGITAGYPFNDSVGFVFRTILGISDGLLKSQIAVKSPGNENRLEIWKLLALYRAQILFCLTAIPICIVVADRTSSRKPVLKSLLILGLLPILVYFIGAYVGDGFPRYFLIAFPPLLIGLGLALKSMHVRRKFAGAAICVLATISMLPQTISRFHQGGSATVMPGTGGYRELAAIVEMSTKPGDLVIGPEPILFYLRDRKWLNIDSFLPYTSSYKELLQLKPYIKGAVISQRFFQTQVQIDFLNELTENLTRSSGRKYHWRDYEILIASP